MVVHGTAGPFLPRGKGSRIVARAFVVKAEQSSGTEGQLVRTFLRLLLER